MGVSGSWNFLCRTIFEKHQYALILNDDIVLRADRNGIENFIHTQKFDFGWSESMNAAAFLLPKATFEEIGWFDEQFFPAYYEDNDYFWRLKCKKKAVIGSYLLDPAIKRASITISKDPLLNKGQENRKRYEKKWGGYPGREKWISPYNLNNAV